MRTFDAERYLRLLGEELLIGAQERDRGRFDSPLSQAASALVAVDAMSSERALSVLEDYELAEALRGEGHGPPLSFRRTLRAAKRSAKALEAGRVVPVGRDIATAEGAVQVHHVILGEDRTKIAVTIRRGKPRRPALGPGRMSMRGMEMPTLTVRDDHGVEASTHFNGGGSELGWQGHLIARPPLAMDTEWIEIEGTRIELDQKPVACEVSIEQLTPADPAHDYLWQLLAVSDHHHDGFTAVDDAIATLVAAQALESDDPIIGEVHAVVRAITREGPGAFSSQREPALPEPWQSLAARLGREDGPEGEIVLDDVVTPEFDGYSVAVTRLTSDIARFRIEAEMTGGTPRMPQMSSALRTSWLAWWAHDDCGNSYLGEIGGWSGGDGHAEVKLGFWPALDPKARRLDLMPTTSRARAVIRLPLAWTTSTGEGT